jgi:hypothetical protein
LKMPRGGCDRVASGAHVAIWVMVLTWRHGEVT